MCFGKSFYVSQPFRSPVGRLSSLGSSLPLTSEGRLRIALPQQQYPQESASRKFWLKLHCTKESVVCTL